MIEGALAFDTSNYTTSVAYFSPDQHVQARKLLSVPTGTLGLRQQDALFQHVRQLPELTEELLARGKPKIIAVGASIAPRETEGSYMPCFLAGKGQGRTAAAILNVPFYPWSHQQGHLAAAAWSAGRLDLLDKPFLAWHLSGGTTELLRVEPAGVAISAQVIGGTMDISAGQLIDRTGVLLGLDFPAGKVLDAFAREAAGRCKAFAVKTEKFGFSLSGMENKVKALAEAGEEKAEIARFVLDTLSSVIQRVTVAAQNAYPGFPVLCSGGVASNSRLRYQLTEYCQAVFSAPEYATDNAMGVAILTHRAWEAQDG